MNPNTRILVNTGILYFKLIFTIIVNLYSTRLILNAMGVEDFGIVNLIAGIVALLSFFQNSMTISTQRFLSVNMGRGNLQSQLLIFNSSVLIHLILGFFVVLLLELITPIIFGSYINIPYERLEVSKLLYQLTIFGTFFVIIAVPYDATLNAHENMLLFSIATIIESLIRLIGAILLLRYENDKLVFYGFLLITIRLVSLLIKGIYCTVYYHDSRIKKIKIDWSLLRRMLSFAGWNMVGGFSVSLRSQGMAIILNIFQGVVINAAYGIANQVSGQLTNFTSTITKAMAPQIMQSKGSGNLTHMMSLSLKQCKYSFILLTFFVVPLFVEMPFILQIWLKQVPENAILFCRLILLVSLTQQLTIGLQTLIQANGEIALYQTIMSILIFLNIPFAYIVLKMGFPSYYVILSMFFVELLCMLARIILAHKVVLMPYSIAINSLLRPVSIILLASVILIIVLLHFNFKVSTSLDFLIKSIISLSVLSIITFFSFTKTEKNLLYALINNVNRNINNIIKS